MKRAEEATKKVKEVEAKATKEMDLLRAFLEFDL